MKVRYTGTALAEIEEILSYLNARNPAAAARVLARIEQVVAHIGEFPHVGHRVDEANVRMGPLGRFPYLIFYSAANDVTILHVRHAARERP